MVDWSSHPPKTRSTNPVVGKFAQVVSLDLYGMAPAKTTSGGSQVGGGGHLCEQSQLLGPVSLRGWALIPLSQYNRGEVV